MRRVVIGNKCPVKGCTRKTALEDEKAVDNHMTKVHPGMEYKAYETQEDAEADVEGTDATEYDGASIAELSSRLDRLTTVIENLTLTITNKVQLKADDEDGKGHVTTPFKTTQSKNKTPVKKGFVPPTLSFLGIEESDDLQPYGKLLLAGNKVPNVVYQCGSKYVYYSPQKATNKLKERPCSVTQMPRVEGLTADELDFLGYEYQN
jgi:hypothetical protein